MHDHRQVRRTHRIAVAALAAALCGAALAAESLDEFRVTVYRDQLAVGDMRFADAATLDGWLKAKHARVRALDNCETAATAQLLAAVERFYPQRAGTLEVRTLAAGEGNCGIAANPFLTDAMYLEVDAQGRSIIP